MEIGHLGRKLLQATGDIQAPDGPLIRGIDWGDVQPYVMFITGRCGSTWLESMLSKTGLVGSPREYLNEAIASYEPDNTDGLSNYFSSVVRRHAHGGRFGLQVDATRIVQSGPLVAWADAFPPEDTATFMLYRRDLVAQAWSWVSARKSGYWHNRVGGTRPASHGEAPTDDELLTEIARLRRDEQQLDAFFDLHGYRPHFVDYETLVAETATTVATILRHLGVPPDAAATVVGDGQAHRKMAYDSKASRLADFSARHADLVDGLHRRRWTIQPDEVRELVLS